MQATKPLQRLLHILVSSQLSVKCGSLFSRNARIPSFWSSRAKLDQNSRLHGHKIATVFWHALRIYAGCNDVSVAKSNQFEGKRVAIRRLIRELSGSKWVRTF